MLWVRRDRCRSGISWPHVEVWSLPTGAQALVTARISFNRSPEHPHRHMGATRRGSPVYLGTFPTKK